MKKKLFSILLSLAMVVTMMPVMMMTAYAADNDAKIGSVEYPTLQDAINAVDNGETIVILKNEISYSTPITINNGKTFTIDFKDDGSTQHLFRWYDMMGTQKDKDIFTISDNSNVTVKDMKYKIGLGERGNRIFKVHNTGTLTLKGLICESTDNIKDTPVVNNGGTVTIDGGDIAITNENSLNLLNPVVQNLGGTTTFTGDGTFTTQNQTGAAWIGRVITLPTQSDDTDMNSECGTVIIENGTFNTGQIFTANGKGNITINNATCNSSLAIIRVFHGGIKSNITIKNITATSTNMFVMVYEELQTKIDFQNGNVKYKTNGFCTPNLSTQINSISIKNGKFGPNPGGADIQQSELQDFLAPGASITALSGDTDGYTYEVSSPPAVCKIGITDYATLEDALSAVTSGQTITMLQDISYNDNAPNFIIDGKTVNIDLNDHKITVTANSMITSADGRKLFTVTNSGNLTMLNGEIVLTGMYSNQITSFTVSGTNSTLTLKNIQQTENADRLITNYGGKVYIDGGIFGYGSTNNIKIMVTDGGTLNIKGGASFKYQSSLIDIGESSNTSPDAEVGTVIIDSATFEENGGGTNIVKLNGKSNVTLNGGTFTGSNSNSAPISIGNYGYKSNVTIKNLTSDSPFVFSSNNNPNIESFNATVNDGRFKYTKGQFAIDRSSGKKPKVKLKAGYYGPTESGVPIASADALAELNANCQSGYQVEELTSADPEYTNEYRYKIVQSSQPTPPGPTPTEEYTVPVESENTVQVEATIESGKAAVKEITKEIIEEVTKSTAGKEKADAIVIDFSKAKQDVTAVELTTKTVENLAEAVASKDNAVEKVTIQMSEATVELDAKTLETVSKEADGNTIKLVVDKTKQEQLKDKQKETLSNYNVNKTFEAYFESNGHRISSFNGGKVVVGIKFTPDAGKKAGNYKVYYVDDEGKIQKFASKYVDGMLRFSTTHFSDYAIVYEGTADVLLLQAKTSGSKTIKLSWNGIDNASKYVVYGAKCGKDYKKLKTVKGKSYTVKKIAGKKLSAHKAYKFYVVGYDAVGNKVKSKTIHFVTANTQGKYANVKSIKAKYDEMLLSVGVSKKISATYKMYAGKKHIKKAHGQALRYISNNPEVAKVSKTGKVTAVSSGTATIYIQDIGGKYCKTKVTVE